VAGTFVMMTTIPHNIKKVIIMGTKKRRKYVSFNSNSIRTLLIRAINFLLHNKMEDTSFQCAPALKRQPGENCLPQPAMVRLQRAWNKTHPKEKITMSASRKTRKNGKAVDGAGSKEVPGTTLWQKIRHAMKEHYKCTTEFCALKKMPGLNAAEKAPLLTFFRPEKPRAWDKKPRDWLDSTHIEDVISQYETADPSFQFIGPVPIDFDEKDKFGACIVDELCNLDLKALSEKGITKIGIVFNLDKHDEPGSHWVCAFIDSGRKTAYYFDSYGYKPEREIVRLLKRCKEQGCDTIYYNDIRHQRKESECGMYCLIVIVCLLKGKSFSVICNHVEDDDVVNAFRDILFAEEKPRKLALDKSLSAFCI